jgi:alcohol dehydrogenase, propanol-preferring
MTQKMTAFRLLEWGGSPQRAEVDIPQPAAGQVLVRVAGVGVCGSDPKMSNLPAVVGDMFGWNMPFTLGHEVGGWIEELGDGVTGFDKGDPVVLVSSHSCGACSYCLEGHDINCVEGHAGRGYGRDGGLAPYVLVEHVREIIKLVSLDPATAGPLVDAGSTAYHGVRRVLPKLTPGSTAVVIGAGGLGSYAIQLLKVLSPARVVAVDTNPARLDFARELGADETFESSDPVGAEGAAVVMDFVGIDDTIRSGIRCLRKGGSFVLVGSGGGTLREGWYSALPKDGEIFTYEGATIADTRAVIALAEAGDIRVDVEEFSFDDIEVAYQRLQQGELQGRAVIRVADTS